MTGQFDLRAWRARMGLTQVQVAALLGCSIRTVAGIERGERQPTRMMIAACQWHEHNANKPA